MRLRPRTWLLLFSCSVALALSGGDSAPPVLPVALPAPEQLATFDTKAVPESSGLVRGKRHAGRTVLWTLSDSGNAPEVVALDEKGTVLRRVRVVGATNRDWEELCIDGEGRLLICDTGDNAHKRADITLYRLPEPDALAPDGALGTVETLRFRYPALPGEAGPRAHDAEGLLVVHNRLVLFTKDGERLRCFTAELPAAGAAPAEPQTLLFDGDAPMPLLVTAAALSDDGRSVALVNLLTVSVYTLPEPARPDSPGFLARLLAAPKRIRVLRNGQVEAAAWNGSDLLLTNEGGTLFRIPGAK